jgi:4-hydroxy-tetrahydrodipicolinate reductase
MMRILVVGHGRMGRHVEALAAARGWDVAGVLTSHARSIPAGGADVAIDFTAAEAVPATLEQMGEAGISVVIGTTGWQARADEVRAIAARYPIGVLASANFSIGLHIFRQAVAEAATRFAAQPAYGAWIHEAHHDKKVDAPSGTALLLAEAIRDAGYDRTLDISSTRAGAIPGTHTVGFDGPADTVTLTHAVRDRAVFALGALDAAAWLSGRRGWFSMDDFLQEGKQTWRHVLRGRE